jgi:transcriptional regulator with XRE-family HTH domain
MSKTVSHGSFQDAVEARGLSFRNAAEAYEYLTGEEISENEAADALWYERLRNRMVAARRRSSLSQAAVADAMGTSQSEVSRLENSLCPGTRLGTLRSYVSAFGASLETLLASPGRAPGAGAGETSAAVEEMRLVIEGEEFTGVEAVGVLESLRALNKVLLFSPTTRALRKTFILGFLSKLGASRREIAASPNRHVRVQFPKRLSDKSFREAIAEPLELDDV